MKLKVLIPFDVDGKICDGGYISFNEDGSVESTAISKVNFIFKRKEHSRKNPTYIFKPTQDTNKTSLTVEIKSTIVNLFKTTFLGKEKLSINYDVTDQRMRKTLKEWIQKHTEQAVNHADTSNT